MAKLKLNLGCGYKKLKGFVNIDNEAHVKPDKMWDLTKTPYPFKKNSVTYINAEYVLEHLPKDKLIPVLNEWYRISTNKAIWNIWVPFYNSRQIANLDHHSGFDFGAFDFLSPKHHRNYYGKVKAKVISVKAYPTARGKFIPFKRFLCHSIGQLYEAMHFKLQVIKK